MNNKIFKVEEINEPLDFSSENKSKYGFVISPKESDKVIYFPNCSAIKEHKDTIKITTVNLFNEEKRKYYEKYKTAIRENFSDDEGYYMDIDEISLSSFMASLGSIVFINTSNGYTKSGFLFIPEHSSIDKKILYDKINEIINTLKVDMEDITQIFNVPSLQDTLLNKKCFNISTITDYCDDKTPSMH